MARNSIPVSAVSLEQFLLANAWVMVDSGQPTIKRKVMMDGNMYECLFRVSKIGFPEHPQKLLGGQQ